MRIIGHASAEPTLWLVRNLRFLLGYTKVLAMTPLCFMREAGMLRMQAEKEVACREAAEAALQQQQQVVP